MEVEVAETDIRDLVFDYLGDFQELSDVKTKDVRVYIQQQLDLPDDYFQGHRKEMLINIITDFRNAPAKQTNASASKKSWQSPSENIEDVEFKEGKFSVTESDLIRKTVARYAEEQGIPIDDLDTSARNKEGRKQAKHLALWSELQDLLPDRKREVSTACSICSSGHHVYKSCYYALQADCRLVVERLELHVGALLLYSFVYTHT